MSDFLTADDISQEMINSLNAKGEAEAKARKNTQFIADFHRASLTSEFAERLQRAIAHFDSELDANHEVGVRLVSFGQAVTFHVENVFFHDPSLIFFCGITTEGNRVELIQHVSQLSFLLMSLPRLDPSRPKRKFGFGPPESGTGEKVGGEDIAVSTAPDDSGKPAAQRSE